MNVLPGFNRPPTALVRDAMELFWGDDQYLGPNLIASPWLTLKLSMTYWVRLAKLAVLAGCEPRFIDSTLRAAFIVDLALRQRRKAAA